MSFFLEQNSALKLLLYSKKIVSSVLSSHTSLEVPVGQKKELLIPPIWGCCGPTGGSIFTPGQKNHPAFFEGRWYTGKMARQIWAEWAVCLSSYLWKGWMVFLPRGKNWTSSRSTTTPDRWYWKFFFSGQLVLPMMCVIAFCSTKNSL